MNTETAQSARDNNGPIHLSLQGKGGVGKPLIASLFAPFHIGRGDGVRCEDTDPVIQALSQYSARKAQHLLLMLNRRIEQRGFDALIEC